MITPADASRRLSILRSAGTAALGLRAVLLAATGVAVMAMVAMPGPAPDALVVIALVVAPLAVGFPDSPLPSVFCFVVGTSFALTADGRIDVSVVVAALALLVVHTGCALAAAAPLPAAIDDAVVRQWAVPTGVLAAVTLAAAGVLAALRAWGPAGSIGVTVGALLAAAGLAWWWSDTGPPGGGDHDPPRRVRGGSARPTIRGRQG